MIKKLFLSSSFSDVNSKCLDQSVLLNINALFDFMFQLWMVCVCLFSCLLLC